MRCMFRRWKYIMAFFILIACLLLVFGSYAFGAASKANANYWTNIIGIDRARYKSQSTYFPHKTYLSIVQYRYLSPRFSFLSFRFLFFSFLASFRFVSLRSTISKDFFQITYGTCIKMCFRFASKLCLTVRIVWRRSASAKRWQKLSRQEVVHFEIGNYISHRLDSTFE